MAGLPFRQRGAWKNALHVVREPHPSGTGRRTPSLAVQPQPIDLAMQRGAADPQHLRSQRDIVVVA